jgi:hypothetical protein
MENSITQHEVRSPLLAIKHSRDRPFKKQQNEPDSDCQVAQEKGKGTCSFIPTAQGPFLALRE